MLESFMKHEVPVLWGLAKTGVDFLKIMLTKLMDYNIFFLRLHSIARILYRGCVIYSRLLAFPMNWWINKHLHIVQDTVVWLHLRKDYLLRALWSYGRRRRYTSQGILLWPFKKTDNHQTKDLPGMEVHRSLVQSLQCTSSHLLHRIQCRTGACSKHRVI